MLISNKPKTKINREAMLRGMVMVSLVKKLTISRANGPWVRAINK